VLNTAALRTPALVTELSGRIGASSTVVAIDIKKDLLGRHRVYDAARQNTTGTGFDLEPVGLITSAVDVPVIGCGGAGGLDDLRQARNAGASAVAAGSLFVYIG